MGIGSCFCCNGWDDVERYMACGKAFVRIDGPSDSPFGAAIHPVPICSRAWTRRDCTIDYHIKCSDFSTGEAKEVSFSLHHWEQYDRWTGRRTFNFDTFFPDNVPALDTFQWIDSSTTKQDSDSVLEQESNAHNTTNDTIYCHYTSRCTGKSDFNEHIEDFRAIYAQMKFQTIIAKMRANPLYRSTSIGYIDGGGIGSCDSYAPHYPDETMPHSVWSGTDHSSHYGPTGDVDWMATLHSTASSIHGDISNGWIMSTGSLSIYPLQPGHNYCHEMDIVSVICPVGSPTITRTSFPTGSATSIKLGKEGNSPGNFWEYMLPNPC